MLIELHKQYEASEVLVALRLIKPKGQQTFLSVWWQSEFSSFKGVISQQSHTVVFSHHIPLKEQFTKKKKKFWEFSHPQAIQDLDEFVSSSEQMWRNEWISDGLLN